MQHSRSQFFVSAVALSAGEGRGEPVRHRAAHRQQFHDLPRADRNSGTAGAHAIGEWLDVPYIPGSFAVNSGDMLKRWSNGRFQIYAAPGHCRRSAAIVMPFRSFSDPASDQRIECLPTCTGPRNPPQWPPITYAEWQAWWYDANYDPRAQKDVA